MELLKYSGSLVMKSSHFRSPVRSAARVAIVRHLRASLGGRLVSRMGLSRRAAFLASPSRRALLASRRRGLEVAGEAGSARGATAAGGKTLSPSFGVILGGSFGAAGATGGGSLLTLVPPACCPRAAGTRETANAAKTRAATGAVPRIRFNFVTLFVDCMFNVPVSLHVVDQFVRVRILFFR